jgi:hypothetical protein
MIGLLRAKHAHEVHGGGLLRVQRFRKWSRESKNSRKVINNYDDDGISRSNTLERT